MPVPLISPSPEHLPLSASLSTSTECHCLLLTIVSSSLAFPCLTDVTIDVDILPVPSSAPHGEL
jgi:hypothetical protein